MSKYFTPEETECHCGCGFNNPSNLLMTYLDRLRETVGQPLTLTNVCRCEEHNAEVGGVPNSQHVRGTAADVAVPEGWTVKQLGKAAKDVGFDGIGLYLEDEFVHVDVRDAGQSPGAFRWED